MSTSLPNPFDSGGLTGAWRTAAYGAPGFEHNRAVAKAAREQSGVWIDLATRDTAKRANSAIWIHRNKPSIAFQPVGAFEFRREQRGDKFVVQVRYVGGPP